MVAEVLMRSDQISALCAVATCSLKPDIKGREIALKQVDIDSLPISNQLLYS